MRSFLFGKEKLNELYQSKRIVVASAEKSSGVSFVSELIAFSLLKKGSVALAELGTPHFYDALSFEKQFLSSGFIDYFEKLRSGERIMFDRKNNYKGVNFIARLPGDFERLSPESIFRLFFGLKEEYCVFDCSSLDHEIMMNLLAEADFPIIVVDPLPSKLFESRDFLEKLRISLPNAILIVNHMNKGVHISELSRFLGTKSFFSVSSVPEEFFYKAEYAAVPISTLPELKESIAKAQDMLSKLFN